MSANTKRWNADFGASLKEKTYVYIRLEIKISNFIIVIFIIIIKNNVGIF